MAPYFRTRRHLSAIAKHLADSILDTDTGRDNIPEGQFTGKDAYLYYWMTNIISEQGRLPTLDMHRWMPLGRDLEGILPFYSYVPAYVHKGISLFFPEVILYHVALFVPVLCFVFGRRE